MTDKELDKLFRDQLENMESTPSPDIWDRIEQQLPKEEVTIKKRNIYPLWRWSAAAAIVATGIFSTWYFQQNEQKAERLTQHSAIPQQQKERSTSDVESIASDPILAERKDNDRLAVVQEKPSEKKGDVPREVAERPEQMEVSTAHENSQLLTLSLQQMDTVPHQISLPDPTNSVTDVPPLKALIESPEVEETMMANHEPEKQKTFGIGTILNSLIGKADRSDGKKLHFDTDEEGSLSIQYITKNRKKNK
ncbi:MULTISPECIES: anti-sigma factor [unclassified Sphingobacterium]|uniref:anti-sigma factor n=1 Tax=unclassified Sphingobacterium TaxID=2609468 RepID=UPI0025E0B169|nr:MULTISPECIES: anti-sigma factor [unclassified Sphingobacterium]